MGKNKHKKIICKSCNKLKLHEARGMCRQCYLKWYAKEKKPYNKKIICKVCKKESIHLAGGMCSKCYGKWRNSKLYTPHNINKSCPLYLGIHIAEQITSKVFKNVKRMPPNNPGYDFICNHDKKIDVKSSCKRKNNGITNDKWVFNTHYNSIADYFLCIAFDNRQNLNPLYLWLIPQNKIKAAHTISISASTIDKWNEYRLDLSKTLQCCNEMKQPARQMCCHASPNPECGRKV